MKKLYALFALLVLAAVHSSNMSAMSRFYGAGRQALPYAGQAGKRMFSSGSLPQEALQQMRAQAPGIGRRFMSQQIPKTQPLVRPGVFTRYWPGWQAARDALAQRGQQFSEMVKRYPKLFTGGTLAWLGKQAGPVLAEEESVNYYSPSEYPISDIARMTYNDITQYNSTYGNLLSSAAIKMLVYSNPLLSKQENKKIVKDLFKQLRNFGYQPDGAFLTKVSNLDNDSFQLFKELLDDDTIQRFFIFRQGHAGGFNPTKANLDRIIPLVEKFIENDPDKAKETFGGKNEGYKSFTEEVEEARNDLKQKIKTRDARLKEYENALEMLSLPPTFLLEKRIEFLREEEALDARLQQYDKLLGLIKPTLSWQEWGWKRLGY